MKFAVYVYMYSCCIVINWFSNTFAVQIKITRF